MQRRNRWVSLVLFDAPVKKILTSPVRIDGTILAKATCDWDEESLSFVVARYIGYLVRKSRKKKWKTQTAKRLDDIEKMIAAYNNRKDMDPVKRSQKYQVTIQMLALWLLLDSCKDDGGIDAEESAALMADWCNTLLPGCCFKADADKLQQKYVYQIAPFQTQFETAICNILSGDNLQHIYFVRDGNICPLTGENQVSYWGYIKERRPRNKEDLGFMSLRFRRKQFENLFEEYCGKNNDLFKNIKDLDVEYIHGYKARMSFLPDEIVKKLMELTQDL